MLLLCIDMGISSIKVCVVDAESQGIIASAHYPKQELPIVSLQTGRAEQPSEMWWQQTQQALALCNKKGSYDPKNILAIGIAYQMHRLILVDKTQKQLRDSIIWCDSRAVEIGDKAFGNIGNETFLSLMLNSPGNFTASKLAWIKQNESEVCAQINKIMLQGDAERMLNNKQIGAHLHNIGLNLHTSAYIFRDSHSLIN